MATTVLTPAPVPTMFQTAEARIELMASEIETHLKSLSLAGLQKLNAALVSSTTLPFGLDKFKTEIESFLSDAIVMAQLAAQLNLIAAAPGPGQATA